MATCLEQPPGKYNDLKWDILQKILCSTQDAAAGGGGSGANLQGVVDPGGVVAATAVGQFYTNTATGTLWQSNATGTGGWVQII